jgi:hypothetical protein
MTILAKAPIKLVMEREAAKKRLGNLAQWQPNARAMRVSMAFAATRPAPAIAKHARLRKKELGIN